MSWRLRHERANIPSSFTSSYPYSKSLRAYHNSSPISAQGVCSDDDSVDVIPLRNLHFVPIPTMSNISLESVHLSQDTVNGTESQKTTPALGLHSRSASHIDLSDSFEGSEQHQTRPEKQQDAPALYANYANSSLETVLPIAENELLAAHDGALTPPKWAPRLFVPSELARAQLGLSDGETSDPTEDFEDALSHIGRDSAPPVKSPYQSRYSTPDGFKRQTTPNATRPFRPLSAERRQNRSLSGFDHIIGTQDVGHRPWMSKAATTLLGDDETTRIPSPLDGAQISKELLRDDDGKEYRCQTVEECLTKHVLPMIGKDPRDISLVARGLEDSSIEPKCGSMRRSARDSSSSSASSQPSVDMYTAESGATTPSGQPVEPTVLEWPPAMHRGSTSIPANWSPAPSTIRPYKPGRWSSHRSRRSSSGSSQMSAPSDGDDHPQYSTPCSAPARDGDSSSPYSRQFLPGSSVRSERDGHSTSRNLPLPTPGFTYIPRHRHKNRRSSHSRGTSQCRNHGETSKVRQEPHRRHVKRRTSSSLEPPQHHHGRRPQSEAGSHRSHRGQHSQSQKESQSGDYITADEPLTTETESSQGHEPFVTISDHDAIVMYISEWTTFGKKPEFDITPMFETGLSPVPWKAKSHAAFDDPIVRSKTGRPPRRIPLKIMPLESSYGRESKRKKHAELHVKVETCTTVDEVDKAARTAQQQGYTHLLVVPDPSDPVNITQSLAELEPVAMRTAPRLSGYDEIIDMRQTGVVHGLDPISDEGMEFNRYFAELVERDESNDNIGRTSRGGRVKLRHKCGLRRARKVFLSRRILVLLLGRRLAGPVRDTLKLVADRDDTHVVLVATGPIINNRSRGQSCEPSTGDNARRATVSECQTC